MKKIMDMKIRILYYCLTLCMALSCVSCTSEDLDEPVAEHSMQVRLTFGTEKATRSELNGPVMDYKDVKRVWLYVFDSKAKGCIDVQDVYWDPQKSGKEYHLNLPIVAGGTYTFMAVGVDEKANETYGQFGIKNVNTPQELKAKLASGKDKKDMQTTQIFAGNVKQDIPADADSESVIDVNITLRRKVAGILAYLGNIPSVVGDNKVTKMRITLGQKQNTEFPLYREPGEQKFGSVPLETDDKVLMEWDLSMQKDQNGIFIFDKTENSLPNTVLRGVFLLPIQSQSSVSTLNIELWGKPQDQEKEPVCVKTYEVKTNGDTNFPICENKLYSIGKKGGDLSEDIPANLSGNLIEIEEMAWNTITVDNLFGSVTGPARIDCIYNQENYIFDADFRDDIDLDILQGYAKTEGGIVSPKWTLSIVYDEFEAGKQKYPTGNKFFINEEKTAANKLRDWIHLGKLNTEGEVVEYVNSVTSENGNGMKLKVILNKYAVLHNDPDNSMFIDKSKTAYSQKMVNEIAPNDYRIAYLKLETEGALPFYYRIRQYNALPIYVHDENVNILLHTIGIMRLDYGQKFDEETGLPIDNSTKIQWGFFSSTNNVFYGDPQMNSNDGYNNSETVFNNWLAGKNNLDKSYPGSALQITRKLCYDLTTGADNSISKETDSYAGGYYQHGYLPAYYELYSWLYTIGRASYFSNSENPSIENVTNLFNTKAQKGYWSSTGTYASYKTYWFQVPQQNEFSLKESRLERDAELYARLVFQIKGFPQP